MSQEKGEFYSGSCACGACSIQIPKSAHIIMQAYCHCHSCRQFTQAPIHAVINVPTETIKVTKGQDNLASYAVVSTTRFFCKTCHSAVYHTVEEYPIAGTYPSLLKDFPFKPQAHVCYEETVLRVKDGLPKFKNFPEPDGKGVLLDE